MKADIANIMKSTGLAEPEGDEAVSEHRGRHRRLPADDRHRRSRHEGGSPDPGDRHREGSGIRLSGMGGYAEKVLRLLVCETLREQAPGVSYDGSMISHLKQVDPWRADANYQMPAIRIEFLKVRQKDTGMVELAWAA